MRQRRSSPPPSQGLLEQRWFTYLLLALVILLIVAFYFSMRYQDELLNWLKHLTGGKGKATPPRAAVYRPPSFSPPLSLLGLSDETL